MLSRTEVELAYDANPHQIERTEGSIPMGRSRVRRVYTCVLVYEESNSILRMSGLARDWGSYDRR
jgi:hypothetical protein